MATELETTSTTALTQETGSAQLLLAEFEDVDSVVRAAKAVRDAGFTRWDVHSPFPIHGIDHAMGIKPTRLPFLVLIGGLTGMTAGIALTIYTNSIDYPFMVGGKPLLSWQAFIPVIFELTVLFSALTAVFGMLLLNRLPQHYNPVFKSERFARVTADRFMLVIDTADDEYDADQTPNFLQNLGATALETVEE